MNGALTMMFHYSLIVVAVSFAQGMAFKCSTSPIDYNNQNPEYTVCPADNQTEKYHSDVNSTGCDYTTTLPSGCFSPDYTVQTNVCWRVDTDTGTVSVNFPLLTHCNYTAYSVTLKVHEALKCPPEADYLKHSCRNLHLKECNDISCQDQCTQRGTLVFRHVFPACYQLQIEPKHNNQPYQPLVSTPVVISDTNYVKLPIGSMEDPVRITVTNETYGLNVRVQSDICPAFLELRLIQDTDLSVKEPCRGTGKPLTRCYIPMNSTEKVECVPERGYTKPVTRTSCKYQNEDVVACDFHDITPGNYCVRITLKDERCEADSVFNNEPSNYTSCVYEHAFYVVNIPNPPDDQSVGVGKLMVFLIVFAIAGLVGMCLLVAKSRRLSEYTRYLPYYYKNPQITKRPHVLLLYARDCPAFMQAVHQFRTVLTKIYTCQVSDCWEESQYHNVAENPSHWLMALLSDQKVSVVLVTSPASVLQESAMIHKWPLRYRQPKAFDSILTHALSSLHNTSSTRDAYNRLFIVRLDSDIESTLPKTRTYLNLMTTYVLPIHLNKLLATLHNLDPSVVMTTADGQMDIELLSETISEYEQYLSENSEYLNGLFLTEGDMTVDQILASIQEMS